MELTERLARRLTELGVGADDQLGIACSGGADSIALLRLTARAHTGEVRVLHVDHGLRPGSRDDAAFVRRVADELGLRCDVSCPTIEVSRGDSVEAVARRARYSALGEAAERHGLSHVATAHTREDQAETVLLGVLRGTGAAGIAPRHGIFVRPLLDVGREELRAWLGSHGHDWREDPTNDDLSYERNWVRHEVMPLVSARRPGAAKAVARLGARIRADDNVLDALAADVFARASTDDVGMLIGAGDLDVLPSTVASRVVCMALRRLGTEPRAALVAEITGGAHRVRHDGVVVHRTTAGLAFVREPLAQPDPLDIGHHEVRSPAWGIDVRLGSPSAGAWRWRTSVPSGARLAVRSRRPGDRVRTAAGTRKLQDVFVDAKIPAFLRDLAPVLTSDDEPVAVVGLVRFAGRGEHVLDAEPHSETWSRRLLWSRATA